MRLSKNIHFYIYNKSISFKNTIKNHTQKTMLALTSKNMCLHVIYSNQMSSSHKNILKCTENLQILIHSEINYLPL